MRTILLYSCKPLQHDFKAHTALLHRGLQEYILMYRSPFFLLLLLLSVMFNYIYYQLSFMAVLKCIKNDDTLCQVLYKYKLVDCQCLKDLATLNPMPQRPCNLNPLDKTRGHGKGYNTPTCIEALAFTYSDT